MDMKKIKIILILCIVMMFVSSIVSAMAVSAYLYNSNEVSYNNNASGITSNNVQGAIDELYEHATDYTTLNAKFDDKFRNNSASYFNGDWLEISSSSSAVRGIAISDLSGKARTTWRFDPINNTALIESRISGGSIGSGRLDIMGNPVMINGTDMTDRFVYIQCTGTDQSGEALTNCLKTNVTNSNIPTEKVLNIQMNLGSKRYGIGFMYGGALYGNFTLFSYSGNIINIKCDNGAWSYKSIGTNSGYTAVN